MARAMVVEQMLHAGFSITTIAQILNRNVASIRHLRKLAYDYLYLEFIDLLQHKLHCLIKMLNLYVFN